MVVPQNYNLISLKYIMAPQKCLAFPSITFKLLTSILAFYSSIVTLPSSILLQNSSILTLLSSDEYSMKRSSLLS